MIQYQEVQSLAPLSMKCDVCGKEYDVEDDVMETQEFHHIDFIGGYASVFGDENHIQCDICQRCLLKMIKGYYRIIDE